MSLNTVKLDILYKLEASVLMTKSCCSLKLDVKTLRYQLSACHI